MKQANIQHTHCCYCRRQFSEEIEYLKRTRDHYIPKSRMGLNNCNNLLQCCHECNTWKKDKMPEHWLREVERLSKKKRKIGNYTLRDYAQIIGSIKHWMREMKGKKISHYKL